jgi:hypothetical protein
VHAPSEEKCDDSKDRFYEELGHFLKSFSEVPYENYIRRFQCKCGKENIFKSTIGN